MSDSENSLSDEAYREWVSVNGSSIVDSPVEMAWREAVRRGEAQIEQNKSEHREAVAKWMIEHGFATGHGDSICALLEELAWQMEERERNAFEAGWMAALKQHGGLLISHGITDWSIQFDEAYRAFKGGE